jgi:hypothetical protein
MSKRTSEGSCDESLYRFVSLWLRSLQRLGSLLQTFLQDCVTLHGTCSKRCVIYHGSSARLPREPNHTLVLYTIRVHSLLGSAPWLGIKKHASLIVFVWIRDQCPDLRVNITAQQPGVASVI